MTRKAAYGSWESPISATDVAVGGERLWDVAFDGDGSLWWSELRPTEGGRSVVVRRGADGEHVDAVPAGWNVRTRVHEYGGGAWTLAGQGRLVFANWHDQRLYLVDAGDPVPLTPEPEAPQGDRYADLVLAPGGDEVWCVRERAVGEGHDVVRDLVAVPLDGSAAVRSLVADGHFLSSPRPSPDGQHLAWLTWDHPRMPWDGTELRVAPLLADGSVGEPRTLIGGPEESVFQPEWAGPDALYAVSDRSGWWNLDEVGLDGSVRALCPRTEEFGVPQWLFGMATYGVLDDGRLAVVHGTSEWRLGVLDPVTGALTDLDLPFRSWSPSLRVRGQTVAAIGASSTTPRTLVTVDVASGAAETVRASLARVPDPGYLSVARADTVPGQDGREVHVVVYPPGNADFAAPTGERPPYVAFVHGGPTAQVTPSLDMEVAYFTSRGIGVVDVNYGGSTGYGRAYRNLLRERWGEVDVEDVVSAVTRLAERGEADDQRLLIRGGSAGGWTVLAALTRTDAFAGGVSYYGVADLIPMAEHTHDFESRYLDALVGPLPETRERYVERSPLSHVDQLSCPVLLLQGLEDQVVPAEQAELFRDALLRKGIPHAYVAFEGEQHGFRKAETIVASLEAELSFYGQVLGFVPPGVPKLPLS
jgi:dipeptidyl aminopeptidase/acylaminoacyl peptidase